MWKCQRKPTWWPVDEWQYYYLHELTQFWHFSAAARINPFMCLSKEKPTDNLSELGMEAGHYVADIIGLNFLKYELHCLQGFFSDLVVIQVRFVAAVLHQESNIMEQI